MVEKPSSSLRRKICAPKPRNSGAFSRQKGDSRDLSNGHWRFIVANLGASSKFIFHGEVTRKETPARPLAGGRGGSDARHHRIKLPPEGQYKDLAVVKDEALYPAVSANCRVN